MPYDDLSEHPEGGRFREVYRSTVLVRAVGQESRSALTHIYFSLRMGEVSRFHRLRSDEVWNLYEGRGLHLYQWDDASAAVRRVELSASAKTFCHVVPASCWQAAVPLSGAVLVGCTVAPGFDCRDFELLEPHSSVAGQLLRRHPDLEKLL